MTVRFESQAEPIAGYRLLERLGSGGFGEVWKAEAPGGIYKAIKIIFGDLRNRETDAFRFAEQELKALKRVKQVRHPYLLALDRYDVVEGRLMIVMELADCNLWDRFRVCRKQGLPGIPREELVRYMSESAEVLDLFNDHHQLQHLDIKPQNLFLLYNHVKVADFGQVKDLQGMMASVTGGITPVYAAPETFDGFVSRFCDQYSLACVYQELLTGVRPFDGASMQQLLMQHLQMPPNLAPSPASDRPALQKALAKKPEDRFPNVMSMVNALKQGLLSSGPIPVSTGRTPTSPLSPQGSGSSHTPGAASGLDSSVLLASDSTPSPPSLVETAPPPERIAPPELTGTGPVRPVLIIGLGSAGLEVVRRFRREVSGRFGSLARLPAIRTLYIDTDPDAVAAAEAAPRDDRLPADQIVLARLFRAGHYLKPRLNGRTLIEGWFDPQLLYKLPRNPLTMGNRVIGRLAFCDHFRNVMQKVQAELDAALTADALTTTLATTGLDLQTNRPRVYIVAGLAGGTGSGMFLDLAYAVRHRLRRWGFINPDVVGLFLVPPEGPTAELGVQAQANTYAALTELHHYTRSESVFTANYDDRNTVVQDSGAPFTEVYLMNGTAPQAVTRSASIRAIRAAITPQNWADPKATRDPAETAAEILRLTLLSTVGRSVAEARPESPAEAVTIRTFGSTRFRWPRPEVVDRAARVLGPVLLGNWVSPDPQQVRNVIPSWAAEHWGRLGLDPETLASRLSEAADYAAGGRVHDILATTSEKLTPRGWLSRLPDPDRVSVTLSSWHKLIGRPGGIGSRDTTMLDEALRLTADTTADAALAELGVVFPALIEAPLFRLAGTEEAIRQMLVLIDRTRSLVEQQLAELDAQAAAAYDQLSAHVNYQKGMRKPSTAEFADAVARYPVTQYRSLLARSAIRLYKRLRESLSGELATMVALRQRVEACQPRLQVEAEATARTVTGDLLPPGCQTAEDAAQVFLRSLTDDDLHALDSRVQAGLDREFGGLYQACLNSTDGLEGVIRVIREESRSYLNDRLGEVDLTAMFYQRFGSPGAVADQLTRSHTAAVPALVGLGPWAQSEVTAFAVPAGDGGDPLLELANQTLPKGAIAAQCLDEVVIYREYPAVPLAALPQLGPAWSTAYQSAPEIQQMSPHARLDVTKWIDVDSV